LSRSSIGAPALALLCFGFLATTAWTGAFDGAGSVRLRTLAWLVEGVFVNSFGRGGAAAALAGLGIALAAILHSLRERRQDVRDEGKTNARRRSLQRVSGERVEEGGSLEPIPPVQLPRDRLLGCSGSAHPPEPRERPKDAEDESIATVFIGTAMVNPEARKPLSNSMLEANYQDVIPFDKKNASGEPMSASDFPTEAWGGANADESAYRQLPSFFYAGGFWFVSAKAAAVLRQFDLGAGALYPVKVFAKDRQTPLGEGWYCINFGNRKTAFLPEQCHRVRPMVGGKWPVFATLKDDEFAVSTDALNGPDIWIDSQASRGFFLSERLGKALKKAKAAHGFYLRSCRVISPSAPD
jgi:hypothetical protein